MESRNYERYYRKIVQEIYPRLRSNPYQGANIKRLKGNLKSVFRYRIGDYRLFYTVDAQNRRVYILEIENRKDAYQR
jgi:mRNA interferase RelE/StbE